MPSDKNLRARTRARNWFSQHGVPISEWAQAMGFESHLVYAVLAGRIAGHRGTSHRIQVALGLKADADGRLEKCPMIPPGGLPSLRSAALLTSAEKEDAMPSS